MIGVAGASASVVRRAHAAPARIRRAPGSGRRPARPAGRCAGRVATVSNCLVSSRQTVTPALRAGLAERRGERLDAVRRLEQHLGRRAPRRTAPALGRARRRAPAGSRRRRSRLPRVSPATDERGERAARARDRHHAIARVARRGDQRRARVAHRRRAGVADVGDPFAAAEPGEHGARRPRARCARAAASSGLVRPKCSSRRALCRVSSQAIASTSRQHVQGAQAQVGEVADRRGDDVERRRGILLAAGRGGRRLDEHRTIREHHDLRCKTCRPADDQGPRRRSREASARPPDGARARPGRAQLSGRARARARAAARST